MCISHHAPGADPGQIRLAFEGASVIHLADSGDLILATELGDVQVKTPLVYQLDPDGQKTLTRRKARCRAKIGGFERFSNTVGRQSQ